MNSIDDSDYITNITYTDNFNTTTQPSTASTNVTSRDVSDEDYYFVWLYVSPLILVTGLVGNSLTLAVMCRRHRKNSTTIYLSAMAVADILALLFRVPPEFFEACRLFVFQDLSRWTCKFEKFSFYTASDVAIWLLVAFTIDRLIAVCRPLSKRTVCAPSRALVTCVTIFLLAVVKNFHVFWTRDEETRSDGSIKVCGRPQPYKDFEQKVRPWLAFVVVSALPFVIISVCNVLIVFTLVRAHAMRRHSLQRSVSTYSRELNGKTSISQPSVSDRSGAGGGANVNSEARKPAAQTEAIFTQTSLMCLGASIGFLVCVTPSIVLTMGRERWERAGGQTQTDYFRARAVMHQLSCLNHAVNFFLYCFAGQRFRSELRSMLRGERLSVTSYKSTTRQYYIEQLAARRSTQTSSTTAFLALRTVQIAVPESAAEEFTDDSG